MTSALLSLSALLTASALAAPAAGAAPHNDRAAGASASGAFADGVPAGWEKVDEADLARITGASDRQKSLSVAGRSTSGPSASGPSASAPADESGPVAIKSVRNGKFTATEVNYAAPHTGALRARSTQVLGAWESFAFEWDEAGDTFAIKSLANNRYVAVEKNFTGQAQNVLRARSTTAGGWERFVIYHNEDLNLYALRSTLNNLFVAMENSYTGPLQYTLRARSADVTGSWEQFDLYSIVG
ncbi:fascin domain-containing protein [Streptomyces sp. NPDC020330]|uniref:fascin domain-containing protein n=1 Tax=unclassified Streptomyces TaxID=2593676 RepID=UPI003790A81A